MNWKEIFEKSNFWAVQVAKQGIERVNKKNKNEVIVRCATTPTGVLHIGNANEPIRAYLVKKAIEVLGKKARVIYTSDDRDPMRGFPKKIADEEGELVEFKEKEHFELFYDGKPVFSIPDPFKCHESYKEHFVNLLFKELKELGIEEIEKYSPNLLYLNDEKWQELVKLAMDKREEVNEILKELKEHVRDYPFAVICEKCGRIGSTHVIDYNKETGEVTYVCESRHLKKKTIQGCGYKGKTTLKLGKLDWYVEWALNWTYFDADIEPMGKDHYLSSWKISPKIARKIFNQEEPIPVLYELFTIDGKKMSSSKGNIYNITFFLKILEPEVFVYYLYTKRPFVQREITLSKLNLAVDEFDKMENKAFELIEKVEKEGINVLNQDDIDLLVNWYLSYIGNIPKKKPVRINYSFLAVIGQLLLPKELLEKTNISLVKLDINILEKYNGLLNKIKEILIRTGHINENIDNFEFYRIIDRMRKASYWAKNFGPEYLKIELKTEKENIDFSEEEKEIIRFIIGVIEELKNKEKINLDEIQTKIHKKIAEKLNPRQFYKKLYKILIGKEGGPKISSLIAAEKEKIKEILSRYI
ncbi:MAG: lysine--tRNA ligase [Nanoarchaeota archaeon]